MIHYQLRCAAAHDFDGWYRDSAAFDQLCARGLVECPHCGGTDVARALMAPAISTRRRPALPGPNTAAGTPAETRDGGSMAVAPAPAAPEVLPPEMVPAGPRMPDRLRAMLQRMRSAVEQNCDYVGPAFAQEARRIHDGEAAARGIYGEATPDEAEALAEDGIEVASIPWIPRAEG